MRNSPSGLRAGVTAGYLFVVLGVGLTFTQALLADASPGLVIVFFAVWFTASVGVGAFLRPRKPLWLPATVIGPLFVYGLLETGGLEFPFPISYQNELWAFYLLFTWGIEQILLRLGTYIGYRFDRGRR